MKKSLLVVVCALAWSATVRAQDTYEKVLDEMIPAFTKFGDTLATIKDKKTADDAKPKLKEVAKTLGDLKERADKLGEPKGKDKEDLEKKYKDKLQEAAKKMTTEMIRISQLDGGMEIVKELSDLLAPLSKKKK